MIGISKAIILQREILQIVTLNCGYNFDLDMLFYITDTQVTTSVSGSKILTATFDNYLDHETLISPI